MDKTPFYRDTWVEVDLDAIFENVENMKKHLADDVKIMAVVKANAYGHGDVQVAKTALEAGAEVLAVAILDEALALRQAGITAPILVLGWVRPQDTPIAVKHEITLTVFQEDWLRDVQELLPNRGELKFHIKMDSGMGRLGVKTEAETEAIIGLINEDSRFVLEGAYTHFATADELDTTYYEKQYERFLEMIDWLKELGAEVSILHSGNSATSLRYPDQVFNMIRLGIAMYGLSPSEELKTILPFPLKPAFSLHSKLTHVKQIDRGESVSYGATYTASQPEWIGTVPVGYADGWTRKLAKMEVLINGELAPIVGRVCMDQLMVKLPQKLARETKVTLIGEQDGAVVSADDVARCLETINYEVSCMISERVPRVYIRHKKITEVNNYLLND